MADHLQGLKGNHDLVVFNEIAGEQQQFCGSHRLYLRYKFATGGAGLSWSFAPIADQIAWRGQGAGQIGMGTTNEYFGEVALTGERVRVAAQ
jgi:hypothetical protein